MTVFTVPQCMFRFIWVTYGKGQMKASLPERGPGWVLLAGAPPPVWVSSALGSGSTSTLEVSWGVPQDVPPTLGPRKALTDVFCEDDTRQAGWLGQAGLHHSPLGALLLIRPQRLYAGHLRPG